MSGEFAIGLALGVALGALLMWLWRRGPDSVLRGRAASLQAQLSAHQKTSLANVELQRRVDLLDQEIQALAQTKDIEFRALQQRADAEKEGLTRAKDAQLLAAEQRLADLKKDHAEMRERFVALAQEVLEKKGQALKEQSKEQLEHLLNPLKTQLKEFRERVDTVHEASIKQNVSLKEQLIRLNEKSEQLSTEADNLTRALKGEAKTRGDWGEYLLESVLSASGLTDGREYELQSSQKDRDGNQFFLDAVVHLPDGKDVVIDSKLSLVHYERYANAASDDEAATALAAHVQAVRGHIKGLSDKSYEQLPELRSLDMVLMFNPLEAAHLAALKADEKLFMDAMARGIMVVSPSTLLLALRIIRHMWKHEDQTRNAQDIADRAGLLYDKFANFTESLLQIGVALDRAQGSLQTAKGRLTGRGGLVGQVEKLQKLGAKNKKSLASELLLESDEP